MKKLNLKKNTALCIFLVALMLYNCSKSEPSTAASTDKDGAETVAETQAVQAAELEKDYLTIEDFKKLTQGLYEKGGVALYESGEIYDVPQNFPTQEIVVFGIPGDHFPPEKPIEKIIIKFTKDEESFLQIQLPQNVYESNPELYLEAEHDGKTFTYKNKTPLQFNKDSNDYAVLDYWCSVPFYNRNLYSKNNDWTIRLKNCKTDELVAEQILKKAPLLCGYVVYSKEYEDPFAILENRSTKVNTKMHLIYKGKGGAISAGNGGTMVVFSYGYLNGKNITYIPFLGVKTKTDDNGVCTFDFSIREPGQYKLDFYDVETQETRYTSFLDFISVSRREEQKHFGKAGLEWKVNSPEGLRLRNMPWGEKVGLLEDGTEVIQTEAALFPFYDYIDGHKGFWIPVKRKIQPENSDTTEEDAQQEKPKIYNDSVIKPDGWVFSGFLTQAD